MANGTLSRINHAEILGLFSAFFVIIGAFLPWATANTIFGSMSVSGIDRDGMITFIFSIIAVGLLYYGIQKMKRRTSGVGLIIIGLLIALIAIVDGVGIAESSTGINLVYIQIGIGLYLTGIGGIGLIISGLWLLATPSKQPTPIVARSFYCIECGNELEKEFKFCTECGNKK